MSTDTVGAHALEGLDPCVHCGFCLQACPTFVETGDEADSPRGRIVLMQQLAAGALRPQDEYLNLHLDRCLGCRACETACPSGVQYGPALEAVRVQTGAARRLPPAGRATLAFVAEPSLRRVLLFFARLARPFARFFAGTSRLGFAAGMLASSKARITIARQEPSQGPTGPREDRGTVVVFRGCIMEGLFGHVNAATTRVLAANGYRVIHIDTQQCCGALHAHAGSEHDAVALAKRNVASFAEADGAFVAVNSAGCGAMLRDYGRLLADDPLAKQGAAFSERVKDVSELLAAAGPRTGAPLDIAVAYDAACHLCHAQKVVDEPLAVLRAIPELRLADHPEADVCCGSAGLYSLSQQEMARSVLGRKMEALRATKADVIATGNPGCIMHIGAGLLAAGSRTKIVHPIELLDASYAEAGIYE